MPGFGFPVLKSLSPRIRSPFLTRYFGSQSHCVKKPRCDDGIHARPSSAFANRNYHILQSAGRTQNHGAHHPALSNVCPRRNAAVMSACPAMIHRSYSSFFGGKGEKPSGAEVPAASGVDGADLSEWVDRIKDACKSMSDAAVRAGEMTKAVSNELAPHVSQLLDSHPYLDRVIIPVTGTLAATVMAWLVMPRVLRRFHWYAQQGSAALLSGGLFGGQIPYEKSIWGALEDPIRYSIAFIAFSQIAMMIAPTSIASAYIPQVWRGSVILSLVWFLHRWKTNVFSRAMTVQNVTTIDRERLLTLDRLSSVGLFVLGLMAFAESSGVAVQSVLTVGGIGGVATAFAARDVLGNVLSGFSLQISKPFSLGDTIKAGSIEGQVVDIGLMTTSLLNAEKLPVTVPNSLLSTQVIVNRSRAQWRAMATKIPLQIDGLEKIPQISNEIKDMLRSNSRVFLGKEAPYCYLSRIDLSFAELTVGCNLKAMSKDEWHCTEQNLLIQSVQIIQRHGLSLGCRLQNSEEKSLS